MNEVFLSNRGLGKLVRVALGLLSLVFWPMQRAPAGPILDDSQLPKRAQLASANLRMRISGRVFDVLAASLVVSNGFVSAATEDEEEQLDLAQEALADAESEGAEEAGDGEAGAEGDQSGGGEGGGQEGGMEDAAAGDSEGFESGLEEAGSAGEGDDLESTQAASSSDTTLPTGGPPGQQDQGGAYGTGGFGSALGSGVGLFGSSGGFGSPGGGGGFGGGGGNNVFINNPNQPKPPGPPTPIPEPGTFVLLALGGGGMAGWRLLQRVRNPSERA